MNLDMGPAVYVSFTAWNASTESFNKFIKCKQVVFYWTPLAHVVHY